MTVQVPLNKLFPHPKNPRLVPREDVVAQITAQLAESGFDEAHALLVRQNGKGYEIISGHHRWLAAKQAKLKEVPCWVREMSDDEAYMALVLNNAQGELEPLEEGLHAIESGLELSDYADQMKRKIDALQLKAEAANVYNTSRHMSVDVAFKRWRNLSEIYTAAKWLWPTMADAMSEGNWTVEKTQKEAKRFKFSSKDDKALGLDKTLFEWADAVAIGTALIVGELEPGDVREMGELVLDAEKDIDALKPLPKERRDVHLTALDEALAEKSPASVAAVKTICDAVVNQAMEENDKLKGATANLRKNVSLEQWKELTPEQRETLLNLKIGDSGVDPGQFNDQTNTAIEWAMYSWNPVTGCLHNCPYCYARDIALTGKMEKKVYPHGFEPAFRPSHLLAPRAMKVPKEAKTDTRYRNVFTCSMADLFGRWVPAEWIEAVLDEVANAPDWNFLFLTKFPKRMAEFDIPKNAWMGTTVDVQMRVANAEKAFAKVKSEVRWLSVEPMLEPLKFKHLDYFNWMVIGGASPSFETPQTNPPTPSTPAWKPPASWIMDLTRDAKAAGVQVYWKDNLLGKRLLEMPFDLPVEDDESKPLPAVFNYLGKVNEGVEK